MTQLMNSVWYVTSDKKYRKQVIQEAQKIPGFEYAYPVDKKYSTGKADVVIGLRGIQQNVLEENRDKLQKLKDGIKVRCKCSENNDK